MVISVVGLRRLLWATQFFAQAIGGMCRGVYSSLAVSVRWIFIRRRQREVVVVGRTLDVNGAVAAYTHSQRGVRFNTNTTTIVRGRSIPCSGETREDA